MTHPRAAAALAAAILAIALGVAACAADSTPSPTPASTATLAPPPTATPTRVPTPTSPPATPTPSPTPTPTSPPPPASLPTPRPTSTPPPALLPTPTPTSTPPPAPVTVTLQPSKDATLHGPPRTGNANSLGSLFVGQTTSQGARRALIAFDVAAIVPAGARIRSATLTVNVDRAAVPDPLVVSLHRVRTRWGEGTSSSETDGGVGATTGDPTWTAAIFNTADWQNPGGDFIATVSASTPVGGPGPYTWASTALLVADVQAWLDDSVNNHGWVLIGGEGADRTAKRLDSRESSTPGSRPTLTVTYTR